MSKYQKIIDFIPYLENPNTEWVEKDEPFSFFYANYSRITYEFMDRVAELMEGPSNTYQVLERYGLYYGEIDFDSFDYENCPPKLAFAILGVMMRAERFCTGEIFGQIQRGVVLKLVKVLAKER